MIKAIIASWIEALNADIYSILVGHSEVKNMWRVRGEITDMQRVRR